MSPSPTTTSKPRRWLHRFFWTLITLASLLTVYYQWENRRSARELQIARERLLARIGTENWLDLTPPVVPDEQSFFARPVIEQWMHREERLVRYVIQKTPSCRQTSFHRPFSKTRPMAPHASISRIGPKIAI